MKRFMTIITIVTVMLSFSVFGSTAFAADFLDDPVIYGLGYYTGTLDKDGNDCYKLVVPAAGTVSVSVYSPEAGDGVLTGVSVAILKPGTGDIVKKISTYDTNTSEKKARKEDVSINKGVYFLHVGNTSWNYTCSYGVRVDYSFDSSSRAKVSSPAKGKVKITAPRGSNVDGFEIRYRVKGDSAWTVKTVAGNKALNAVLKVKSGKKYEIQTRKYVTDDYEYKYFSKWTKRQTVKVK